MTHVPELVDPLRWPAAGLDPLAVPEPSHGIDDAPPRARVVLRGLVLGVVATAWVGGPVLEAILADGTGAMCLAFLGRCRIPGIEPGRVLTVAGTVGRRAGRPLILNPIYWLHAAVPDTVDG